jgi:hypothetical protein
MGWIDNGCNLVWDTTPPVANKVPSSKTALEHHDFVTKAISEIVEAGATSALPTGIIPKVTSPLGDVSSQTSFGYVALHR